jgi:paraquat-inducible protein B
MTHEENVHARKEEIERRKDQQASQESLHEDCRHDHASRQHQFALSEKVDQAHHSMAHASENKARKDLYDAIDESEQHAKQHEAALKSEMAAIQKQEHNLMKSLQAKKSNEDINAAHIRKELYDAIDKSEKEFKHHEKILKEEFGRANHADYLHGIQEKQAHLQK